eukprot:GHUV01017390.1.p1 GENE.GHUV01017390.1~~GHUV01017390.1.p1  ORF type:complete len:184 (+),score=45.58 GHUV01017390.1:521-1072(+)
MRDTWQIVAASAAAFAAGAAAGAYCMKRWCSSHTQQQVPRLDLAALQALQSPSCGLSPATSIAPSVYSLPGTPRVSANGRNMGRSDSVGSAGGDSRLRMVFVVRKDLSWNKQKTAVMVAHAALALFKKVYKSRNPALSQWEMAKGPKVVLRADDEQQLLAVAEAAREQGIPSHSIAEPTGNTT